MQIAIILGSQSDLKSVKEGVELLRKFKVDFELKVLSAHRSPKQLTSYIQEAEKKGVKVFIGVAGGSAALPGVIASQTTLPVIGVPVETKSLKGLDSLLSIVQMPKGVPVGCMTIGKAGFVNAVIFALEILGIKDKSISLNLKKYKKDMAKQIKDIRIKL
ncbi:MAG: 5-(carboxyamino)imidazole ribonucleotide mutase [Candidatus Omnitrophica bacterium]|nr:5-(carboxyamino)imidazole ribonucleotide mutase [Candidatus Omnitrophota bacterium]MCM8800017.1 5-(carboxyamino)imidazole ribonucleotide mutase [Candidatus Omnitrophota bacterium]